MRIAMHDSPKTSYIIVTWSIQSKRFQKKIWNAMHNKNSSIFTTPKNWSWKPNFPKEKL